MKQASGKALLRALRTAGWTLDRVNGSHHILTKPGEEAVLSVPVHGNRPLKPGLLRHLMKCAGLGEKDI